MWQLLPFEWPQFFINFFLTFISTENNFAFKHQMLNKISKWKKREFWLKWAQVSKLMNFSPIKIWCIKHVYALIKFLTVIRQHFAKLKHCGQFVFTELYIIKILVLFLIQNCHILIFQNNYNIFVYFHFHFGLFIPINSNSIFFKISAKSLTSHHTHNPNLSFYGPN